MSNYLTFAFIGGDQRQVNVIKGFAVEGYRVNVFGIESDELRSTENTIIYKNMSEALSEADIVVLPLPYLSILDSKMINSPLHREDIAVEELFKAISDSNIKLVLAGKVDEKLLKLSEIYGIQIIDYIERDELAILNAIPTAEGAVSIAMEELPITIHSSECLCIGYGRVGKVLARTLYGLGAKVTVAVRKPSDIAFIKAYGYTGINITEPLRDAEKYDIVFNTVPAKIVDENILQELSDDCVIIDLASKPGGVDFEIAKILGKKVIWALSLPGKVAPLTAGTIIKDTIKNILSELGVT